MLPFRQPIHIKCTVFINNWTDVEEVDNLLAPRGSPCSPECPDSRGKSSEMSRDLPANQTVILAVNQIVRSLCDMSKTSSEPLLLTVLLTLLCYVPAACWPLERISGTCERSRLTDSAFVVCVLAAAGRGSCAAPGPACAPLPEQLLVLKGRGSHLLPPKRSPNSSEQEIQMQLFSEHC